MTVVAFLAEWALRSSILIASGASLLFVLRVRDSSVRLAAWTAMLAGSFLIPFMTTMLPGVSVRVIRAAPPIIRQPTLREQQVFDFVAREETVPRKASPSNSISIHWVSVVLSAYFLVAAFLLLRLITGLVGSRRLLRASRPTSRPEFLESRHVSAPVTLGIVRPVIVLPPDWPVWEEERLRAILAHENAHIRRYDPLIQLLSAVHRTVLWFNPLVWLMHSRIVRLAEEASDDAAISVTIEPAVYAEVLLDFMRRPAILSNFTGVPMARYGSPNERIHRILNATSFSRGITRWTVMGILVMGMPLSYLAAALRPERVAERSGALARALSNPQDVSTPIPEPTRQAEKRPQFIAQAILPPLPQESPAQRPKFDVASIRPCDPDTIPVGGRGGKPAGGTARFRRNCITVQRLIEDSYIRFADGKSWPPMQTVLTKIEGGAAWINSDRYTIEAESEGASTNAIMNGPMTQTLLEDRFQLKVHRETRDGPIYELTVAKGGSKLPPAKPGPCVRSDFAGTSFPFFEPGPGDENPQCRLFLTTRNGPNILTVARFASMDDFAANLTGATGRLVVNKTDITEPVDFRLVYAPDDNNPQPGDTAGAALDPAGPSIFVALEQQLGLKLQPARSARAYLVIDSISRPSPN